MNKKTGESTTTNKVEYPQYIQDAQRLTTDIAGSLAAPHLQNVPKSAVAGLNADQLKSFELTRDLARDAGRADYSGGILKAANAGQGILGAQMGAANTVDGDQIKEMLNPYLDEVGGVTLDNMRREYQNSQALNDAQFANQQAFGGSGQALAKARLARGYNENVGSAIAGIRSKGYDTAQGAAFQNAGIKEAAASRNAALAGQQAALGMQGATGANNAFNDSVNRRIVTQGLLSAAGDKQQGQAQKTLDVPWDMIRRFQSTFPGAAPNTSSTKDIYSNPAGGILGAGLSIFGGGL